jgi:choline dehydrogenase-like flavoprotein
MRPLLDEPEFDVVVIGSGVAGALLAHRLALAKYRVLMLEAGGVPPDSLGRWAMVHNYIGSSPKAPDAPFCGDDVLPLDSKTRPLDYRYAQPNPIANGENYYFYDDSDPTKKSDRFKSFYERLVGGSTWHWQGIYVRMLPRDFGMQKYYGVGFDWPLSYDDVEPWYVEAEYEMGVSGSDEESKEYYQRHFGAYRSKRYPMPALVPSYLDKELAKAINGTTVPPDGMTLPNFPGHPLKVNTVAHAINSRLYDGRQVCDGHTSCVPLCPIKARYEAIVHVEKALTAGATLRTQAIVTKLELDENHKTVKRVWFRRWDGSEDRVSGRIVVLAANGIENPRLLLLSNVANSSGLVGCYLMDHPIKQSFALAHQQLFPFRGPQTTSDIAVFRDGPFRRQMAGFKTSIKNDGWSSTSANTSAPRGNTIPKPHPDKPDSAGTLLDFVVNQKLSGTELRKRLYDHATRQITLNSACEQLPIKENRVTLAKGQNDSFGIARPQINYRLYDDKNYLRNSFQAILKLHGWVFDRLGVPASDRFMQDDPTVWSGSGHIMGTTTMGHDSKASVVDKECRAHDHPNLFVLGSSVFPTSSTANPTSTIAALALRAANTIKKQLKG